ncbi:MAG TPA: hypothetical protein V6C81_02555 [Planktothrix sp.]|jgi:hypothetical protein
MSNAQERIAVIQGRIEALLTVLDATNLSDTDSREARVFQLLLQAAEYTAMADDIRASGPVLAHLLVGEEIETALGERTSLLGISLGHDGCALIALPPLPIGHNDGACISPDPSAMFPGTDASRPQPKDQPADRKSDATQPPARRTIDGAKRQTQQLFQPTSSNPEEALQELTNELFTRAERLLDQAQKLKSGQWTTEHTPLFTCSTADYR